VLLSPEASQRFPPEFPSYNNLQNVRGQVVKSNEGLIIIV